MQKYFTYIIAAFIIYNLFEKTNFSTIKSIPKSEVIKNIDDNVVNEEKFEGTWFEKKVSKIMANIIKTPEGSKFFENLVKPMQQIPQSEINFKVNSKDLINSLFKIKINKPGYGVEAVCGCKVSIDYALFDMKNNFIKNEQANIIIGKGDLSKSLENSIIGMRVGEEREVNIYPTIIKDPKFKTSFKAKIKLDKLETTVAPGEIRYFDDTISYAKPILCGEKVKFDVTIMDVTGKIIFEKQDIVLNLGFEGVPVAFSQGIFNKTSAGTRTIIAKGKNLSGTHKAFAELSKIKINLENYYILDIKNTELVGE
jgi:hypothetical protein